jgi:hypothetical protein
MQLLDDHLWSLYDQGIISVEELLDKCRFPGQIKQKLDANRPGWSQGGYGPIIGGENTDQNE